MLYYCAVYWQIDFYSAKHGYKPIPKSEILTLGEALKSGWIYLIPIAVLIYFLLVVRWSPASAIYRSLVVLIAIAVIKKEDRKYFAARVKSAFMDAGISGLPTVCVSAASGIIMASVTMTGLGLRLSSSLEILANGNLMILAILAAACIYIMGMGMAPIVSYILMAILVAPAMVNMGVSVRDMHSSARHCAH